MTSSPRSTGSPTKGLNLQKATPASWSLAGAGTLAAYQVTLNALEIEETE